MALCSTFHRTVDCKTPNRKNLDYYPHTQTHTERGMNLMPNYTFVHIQGFTSTLVSEHVSAKILHSLSL